MKRLFLIFFFTCTICIQMKAQSEKESQFEYNIGLSLPTNEFADDNLGTIRAGLAGVGLATGIKFISPTKMKGLSLIWGLDLIINPYSKDAKENFEKNNRSDYKYPIYFHIPIRGGIDYRFSPQNNLDIFFNGGLSADVQKRTNMTINFSNGNERVVKFDVASGFGGFIGGGLKFNNKMSFGVDYYLLGKHRMKANWDDGQTSGKFTPDKFSVTFVKLYTSFNI